MSHPFQLLPRARSWAFWAALAFAASAQAQSPKDAQPEPADGESKQRNERIERISHEDGLSRVDELRVNGQTRRIDVTPKNGAPAYEIAPAPGGANLSEGSTPAGNTGKSSWRIFSF
jgi:hypothetical protein